MPYLIRYLIVIFLACSASVAFAEDDTATKDRYLNRDRMPSAVRATSKSDLKKVELWLDTVGLSGKENSFARDLFCLQLGVQYPINDTLNLFLAGNSRLRFGVTFR